MQNESLDGAQAKNNVVRDKAESSGFSGAEGGPKRIHICSPCKHIQKQAHDTYGKRRKYAKKDNGYEAIVNYTAIPPDG